jgi:uncharacterized membrane protein YphA (DoxX/SURF4 family)
MNAKIIWVSKTLLSTNPLLSKPQSRRLMLALQFLFGLLWLEGASWKVLINGHLGLNYEGLAYWVSKGSEHPVFGPYKWLIDSFILPNIKLFLPLVFLAELTIGLLFASGKYIRVAAVLAFGQTIAIMLSVLNTPNEWKWSYILMLIVSVIFLINPTTSKWARKK